MRRLTYILIATLFLGGCHQNIASEEVDDIHIDDYLFEEVLSASREDFSGYWANQDYLLTMQESMLFIQDRVSGYVNSFDILSEEIIDNILSIQVGDLNQDNSISLISTQDIPLLFEFKEDQLFVSDTRLRSAKFRPLSGEVINERLKLFVHSKGEYGMKPYQGPDLTFEDFTGYFANYDKFHASDGVYSELGTYYFSIQDGFFESGWIGSSYMMSHILDYEINGNTMTYRTRRFLYEDNGYLPEEETDPKQNTIEVFKITLHIEEDQDRAILHSSGTIFKRVTDQELSLHALDSKYEENVAATISNLAYMNRVKDQLSTDVREVFDFDAEVKNYPYSVGDLSEVQLYKEHQIIKGKTPHPEQDVDADTALAILFEGTNYETTPSLYETGIYDSSLSFTSLLSGEPEIFMPNGTRTYWRSAPPTFFIEDMAFQDNIFTFKGQYSFSDEKTTLRYYRISDDILYGENSDGEFTERYERGTEWLPFHNLPRRNSEVYN